jgi:hypothetical protein
MRKRFKTTTPYTCRRQRVKTTYQEFYKTKVLNLTAQFGTKRNFVNLYHSIGLILDIIRTKAFSNKHLECSTLRTDTQNLSAGDDIRVITLL